LARALGTIDGLFQEIDRIGEFDAAGPECETWLCHVASGLFTVIADPIAYFS
jgi:hypothetical protein